MTDQSLTKKRQRRPETRPSEILAAALALFSEHGFSATRMEDVAARAGISKGAIYLYFPDKTALLKALVQQAIGGQISMAARMVDQVQGPVTPLISQLLLMFAQRIATTDIPSIIKLVISESRAHPDIGKYYLDNVILVAMPIIEGLLEKGIASGEFRNLDSKLTVKCLIGPMLLGAIWRSVFQPLGAEPIDVNALATQHLDIFLRGLRP
jgi:AcrR family transcriptional regulator